MTSYEAFRAERMNAPSQGKCFEDMNPAEKAAAIAKNAATFDRNRLRHAQANGFRTVAEYEACQRYAHGGSGE